MKIRDIKPHQNVMEVELESDDGYFFDYGRIAKEIEAEQRAEYEKMKLEAITIEGLIELLQSFVAANDENKKLPCYFIRFMNGGSLKRDDIYLAHDRLYIGFKQRKRREKC